MTNHVLFEQVAFAVFFFWFQSYSTLFLFRFRSVAENDRKSHARSRSATLFFCSYPGRVTINISLRFCVREEEENA